MVIDGSAPASDSHFFHHHNVLLADAESAKCRRPSRSGNNHAGRTYHLQSTQRCTNHAARRRQQCRPVSADTTVAEQSFNDQSG